MHWGFALGALGLTLVACGSTDSVNPESNGGAGNGAVNGGAAGTSANGGRSNQSGSAGVSGRADTADDGGASGGAGVPTSSADAGSSGSGGAHDADSSAGDGGAAPSSSRPSFIDKLGNLEGCLPRTLPVDGSGQVSCSMIEARPSGCDCTAPGRAGIASSLAEAVRTQLAADELCTSGSGAGSCADYCFCTIEQEQGAAATACQTDPSAASTDPAVPPGFCYIDDPASPALAQCVVTQKQRLGFVSPSATPVPISGASLFIACQ